jgi:hypothetical protein
MWSNDQHHSVTTTTHSKATVFTGLIIAHSNAWRSGHWLPLIGWHGMVGFLIVTGSIDL